MSQRLQELELKVAQAQEIPEKVAALNALAEYLCDVDVDKSWDIASEALSLSQQDAYPLGIVTSLLNQAWICHVKSDFARSATIVFEALGLAREFNFIQPEIDALNILGNDHQILGNYADALDCFTRALVLCDQITNQKNKAVTLNNIGFIYRAQNDHQQALQHFEQALEVYRSNEVQGILPGLSMINIARTHLDLGNEQATIQRADEALKIFQSESYGLGQAYAFLHKGEAVHRLGSGAEAHALFQQALEKIRPINTKLYEGEIEKRIGQSLLEQHETRDALEYLRRALDIFQSLDTKPEIFETHELLAKLYKSFGDFETAFEHLELSQKLKQEVFNTQADSRQKTLQAIYEVERAQLEANAQRQRAEALQHEITLSEQTISDLDAYADNVAHDLRNPIGVIIGYSTLLESSLGEKLDAESQVYLDTLKEATEKLDQIVEALLTLAKARKAEIMPQAVDMQAVVLEAQKRLQTLAEKYHAVIHVDRNLPEVMGHATWLEEVCVNYISNAIKYSGASPVVSISATKNQGSVCYSFQDNGPGLSPEQVARLFSKFERLGKQKIDGHGLGLTIVKTVVEKLGGEVSVSSPGIPGEGCQFTFTLPSPKLSAFRPE